MAALRTQQQALTFPNLRFSAEIIFFSVFFFTEAHKLYVRGVRNSLKSEQMAGQNSLHDILTIQL